MTRKMFITFREAALRYPGERRLFRRANKFLGDFLLADITNETLAGAAAAIHGNAESSTAIREFWTKIKRFFRWCAKEGLCEPRQIIVPRPPKSPPPRILTVEEEALLIAQLPDHVRPFVMFLLSTGCLIEEARLLQWRRLDLDRGVVWFPRAGNRRQVPLEKDMIAELRWMPHRDGYVFRKPNGEQYASRRLSCVDKSAFNRACIVAGLESVTQKSLQYAWVVRELAKGRLISELLKVGASNRKVIARLKRDCKLEIDSYRQWLDRQP